MADGAGVTGLSGVYSANSKLVAEGIGEASGDQVGGTGNVALTKREKEVLHWISIGKSDWQIGQILKISAKTANYHVENVKRKFGVSTRTQAVFEAVRRGQLC